MALSSWRLTAGELIGRLQMNPQHCLAAGELVDQLQVNSHVLAAGSAVACSVA